ncbi:MAG: SMC-Scp complex subunit ScpB [Candidatus Omnitrophota bacterium]|nr:MAG: SMC-Scp complex subunit ScpB [Candidatus Omnitrophota bacterium]
MDRQQIKSIVESLLFINEKPIELKELCETLSLSKKDIEAATNELIAEYKSRASGICVVKVAGGYQMCSAPGNEEWVKRMYRERGKQKLSVAALECLAIVAYKQPITKMEIEAIRGVNVDGVTKNLVDFGLIKIAGRKEVVGRPFIYITTRKFLEYFGLNSLKDLPRLEEFIELAKEDKVLQELTEPLFKKPETAQEEIGKNNESKNIENQTNNSVANQDTHEQKEVT